MPTRPKMIEIRDPLHGPIQISQAEANIVDSPYFQRLRQIKQLGFTELAFPGATHNRYSHSLGAMHLAGKAFDTVFQNYTFKNDETRKRLRQTLRLAALMHDIGHGPLSHTSEAAMPALADLNVPGMVDRERQANHEDYTLKIVLGSSLTKLLENNFSDIPPQAIAALFDTKSDRSQGYFINDGLNLHYVMSQIVSSELDIDRMDYLMRDSYYCGTNYGKFDIDWLLSHLCFHQEGEHAYLALDQSAIYTLEDFLLARYHMYLMVYFHAKSMVYDELLLQYLKDSNCAYRIPSNIEDYLIYDDYHLYTHLRQSENSWAQCIAVRDNSYRRVFELHGKEVGTQVREVEAVLKQAGITTLFSSSSGTLSKYYRPGESASQRLPIYVVNDAMGQNQVKRLEESTDLFSKYAQSREMARLYVPRESVTQARELIAKLSA